MRNARVLLVHDDVTILEVVSSFLAKRGHKVVLKALDVRQANNAIYGGRLEEEQVTVAIVATNLSEQSRQDHIGSDGKIIIEALTKVEPEVKTVAYYPIRRPDYGHSQVCQVDPIDKLLKTIADF